MAARLLRTWPTLSQIRLGSVGPVRFVSKTSSSGSAGATTVSDLQPAQAKDSHGHAEVSVFEKNPDYHGFSDDPHADMWNMRWAFFCSISLAIVVGGTFIHYLPDPGMRGWARREAEKLIKQREAEGLPLIDENYYDPSKIILPSAEGED